MCRIYKLINPQDAAVLFSGWQETMIDSCLQGIMGEIYAARIGENGVELKGDSDSANEDSRCTPETAAYSGRRENVQIRSAMAVLGDFCFLAGEPDVELVSYKPENCDKDFMIMVPQDSFQRESGKTRISSVSSERESGKTGISSEPSERESAGTLNLQNSSQKASWEELIRQVYGDKVRQVTRYAFKKEEHIWDMGKLQEAVSSLSSEYSLRLIDEELYRKCLEKDWSRDLVAQYLDYEQYRKLGLGVAILQGQEIVAGASSYSSYDGGIEIEIDTREDHRREGLAYACGARLILECCSRNLYPSWDAQNLHSVALAEKLGYHVDHAYTAYEIWGV